MSSADCTPKTLGIERYERQGERPPGQLTYLPLSLLFCFYRHYVHVSFPSFPSVHPFNMCEKRCERPSSLQAKARAMVRAKGNKESLLDVETNLQRIMADFQILMLTDIRKAQGRVSHRDVTKPTLPSSNAAAKPADEPDAAGQVMLRLSSCLASTWERRWPSRRPGGPLGIQWSCAVSGGCFFDLDLGGSVSSAQCGK